MAYIVRISKNRDVATALVNYVKLRDMDMNCQNSEEIEKKRYKT